MDPSLIMEEILAPNASIWHMPDYNSSILTNWTFFMDNYNMTADLAYYIQLQKVLYKLNVYVIPLIISLGLIGNSISFVVFVLSHLSRQSSSVYLAFLAAVDNLFLISLLAVWLGWVDIHVFHKNGWCQSILYCNYVCSFLSNWTVVSFTSERYIIVYHPLKRHRLCTRGRALCVMVSLTACALAYYSFVLFTTGIQQTETSMPICMPQNKYFMVLKIMSSIDTLISLVIPSLAIVCMNTAIGIKIYTYTKRLNGSGAKDNPARSFTGLRLSDIQNQNSSMKISGRSRMSDQGEALSATSSKYIHVRLNPNTSNPEGSLSTKGSHGIRQWRVATQRRNSQMKVTRSLLIISTVFILLNIPSHGFRLHAFVMLLRNQTVDPEPSAMTWQAILQFLHYLSFSSNFLLYSICSRNFRYALKRLIKRFRYNLKQVKPLPLRSLKSFGAFKQRKNHFGDSV